MKRPLLALLTDIRPLYGHYARIRRLRDDIAYESCAGAEVSCAGAEVSPGGAVPGEAAPGEAAPGEAAPAEEAFE